MAQAYPDGREDSVADGRTDDGRPRLAQADRHFRAVDKLDVNLGHVANAQWPVGVEIRVLAPAL